MQFKKTAFAMALGGAGLMAALSSASAFAVALNNGDTLTINLSTAALGTDGNGASYFGMDTNGDGTFQPTELTRLKPSLVPGNLGIVIGQTYAPGPSHKGPPGATETGDLDKAWGFFGNTGSDFLVTGVTGSTEAGLDFSGWRVTWSGIPSINMGGGAPATLTWNGVYGDPYRLDYFATVPNGDPSGFGGVSYKLHLEGVVAVPEASTYGMMLAGLGLVGFMARRRVRS